MCVMFLFIFTCVCDACVCDAMLPLHAHGIVTYAITVFLYKFHGGFSWLGNTGTGTGLLTMDAATSKDM